MQRFGRIFAMIGVAVMVMVTAVDVAEARRAGGGGFGSRGTRTFSPPPANRTAPTQTAPIDRSMTQKPAGQQAPGANQQAPGANRPAAQRPGMFGGLAGGLLGGLMMGGLIGMLMGNGLGGAAGFLGLLLQAGLVIGAIMLAMRFFGRGSQPALGGAGASMSRTAASGSTGSGVPSFSIPRIGSGLGAGLGSTSGGALVGGAAAAPQQPDEIGVRQEDLEQFEQMLKGVQAAYGAEDYAALRKLTTPEAMSWLAEELSDNATSGVKNEVRDVHLVQGDVAEAWNEDGADYATVAMRYESIDVMRDRATGKVVSGDPDNLTESVEVWTFVRKPGSDWLVSAIQGTEAA
ncbi:putative lipid-binding transport protein (Tim44 family) [Mycoplana sp. BE70]|uniref:Tim44 domain-containing protein n=1 Tax=Mycoplana sp. BE70 TaxID=2817775 RepID=UPI00285DE7F6|nr:Tim44 domain-containing protein [Mycoplana sp. BE70]MDR6754930.1 putative lipid-binding transport protein (Tim44 family) [Mycoplana sp. BE70]